MVGALFAQVPEHDWDGPFPPPIDFNDFIPIDNDSLLLVGDAGMGFYSNQYGGGEPVVLDDSAHIITAADVADRTFALMVGEGAFIKRSTDGGDTWTASSYPAPDPEHNLNDVAVVNADTAYIVGDDAFIAKTTDRGDTWTRIIVDSLASHRKVRAVSVVGENVLLALGSQEWNAAFSDDGGETWSNILPDDEMDSWSSVHDVRQLVGSDGFLFYYNSYYTLYDKILAYSHYLDSWSEITIPSEIDGIEDFFVKSASEYHLADVYGDVYWTENGGSTWVQTGDDLDFTTIDTANDGNLWAAGENGVFADFTWNDEWDDQQYREIEGSVTGLAAAPNGVVFASTGSRNLYRSDDHGDNWLVVDSIGYAVDIEALSEQILLAGFFQESKVRKSLDGGLTWSGVSAPFFADDDYINEFVPVDGSTVYAVSDSGYIGKTTDGGDSWQTINDDGKEVVDAFALAEGRLSIVTDDDKILRTTDDGATWTDRSPTGMDDVDHVYFRTSTEGYALGENAEKKPQIYGTQDGGANWTNLDAPVDYDYSFNHFDAVAHYGDEGSLFFGPQARIYYTDDKGQTWSRTSQRADVDISHSATTSNGTILAGGRDGLLVRFETPAEALAALTHTPGDLEATVYNDGSIGGPNEGGSSLPSGVRWKTENGAAVGGLIFGSPTRGSVNGLLGSFTSLSNGERAVEGIARVQSDYASGFDSTAEFDQISVAVLTDKFARDPYEVTVTQKTYSSTGDPYVFIRYGFRNDGVETIEDFHSGMFMDWDVGPGAQYELNDASYIRDAHFGYVTDKDLPAFGVVAASGLDGLEINDDYDEFSDVAAVRNASMDYLSTVDQSDAPADADLRQWIGTNLGDLPVDSVKWATFAVVAGENRSEIDMNARLAVERAGELGWTETTVGAEESDGAPEKFSLKQNYPNPFNPTTTIRFALPEAANVELRVYNTLGEEVTTLLDRRMTAGDHRIRFSGASLANGVYIYRLAAGDRVAAKKMILLK